VLGGHGQLAPGGRRRLGGLGGRRLGAGEPRRGGGLLRGRDGDGAPLEGAVDGRAPGPRTGGPAGRGVPRRRGAGHSRGQVRRRAAAGLPHGDRRRGLAIAAGAEGELGRRGAPEGRFGLGGVAVAGVPVAEGARCCWAGPRVRQRLLQGAEGQHFIKSLVASSSRVLCALPVKN